MGHVPPLKERARLAALSGCLLSAVIGVALWIGTSPAASKALAQHRPRHVAGTKATVKPPNARAKRRQPRASKGKGGAPGQSKPQAKGHKGGKTKGPTAQAATKTTSTVSSAPVSAPAKSTRPKPRRRSPIRKPSLGARAPRTSSIPARPVSSAGPSPRNRASSGASSARPIASPVAPLPLLRQRTTGRGRRSTDGSRQEARRGPIGRTVHDVVEVLPDSVKIALAALAALSILLGGGYLFAALRARRLGRQRAELLAEVGLLQEALLPAVPRRLRSLRVSVAYRPADGPGAGGDFYDVLRLPGGRSGFIVGDISGHGKTALARTTFLRYTLGAYLEAGLEPRAALQVAERVVGDKLGSDLATVLVAVHDADRGSLTYACAGHPPPIVVGALGWSPITQLASPPLGVGYRTGLRQTTVPLPPDSIACMFTDGLPEARTHDGILGRGRLGDILAELGEGATAQQLVERVADEAWTLKDDMAACVIAPVAGTTVGSFQAEELELTTGEVEGGLAFRFLRACSVEDERAAQAEREAAALAKRFGGVVLRLTFGNRLRVEVLPRNVASIELAQAERAREA